MKKNNLEDYIKLSTAYNKLALATKQEHNNRREKAKAKKAEYEKSIFLIYEGIRFKKVITSMDDIRKNIAAAKIPGIDNFREQYQILLDNDGNKQKFAH